MQDENISRATKKDYDIEIFFVYRPLKIAKEYTEIREEKEGRNMPENIFYEKFINSINTVNEIAKKYPNVKINYYDLNKKYFKENIKDLNEIIESDINLKDDISKAKNYINSKDILINKKSFQLKEKNKSSELEK